MSRSSPTFISNALGWLLFCILPCGFSFAIACPVLFHRARASPTQNETLSSFVTAPAALAARNSTSVPPPRGQAAPAPTFAGKTLFVDGRSIRGRWHWQAGDGETGPRFGISDGTLRQTLGFELLDSRDPERQPVGWFAKAERVPIVLPTFLHGGDRYLDLTEFARETGWQVERVDTALRIASPSVQIEDVRYGRHPWGRRWVVQLDRPGLASAELAGTVRVAEALPSKTIATQEAAAIPSIRPPRIVRRNLHEWEIHISGRPSRDLARKLQQEARQAAGSVPSWHVEERSSGTAIAIRAEPKWEPRLQTLADPPRVVFDLQTGRLRDRDIQWAEGIRWRQQQIVLGSDRFPVRWLEIDPQVANLRLRPIYARPDRENTNGLVGIASLAEMAERWGAYAAINGGFFNRNTQMPLGALRSDGIWLSSPILNRGAIAWNDDGAVDMDRLDRTETVETEGGDRFLVFYPNSGYVKAGISRYTRAWGETYTPVVDGEILVEIQSDGSNAGDAFPQVDRVVRQICAGKAGEGAYPIPANGYLLTLRSYPEAAAAFEAGRNVILTSETVPAAFATYANILGAGPLLVRSGRVVLDAESETFQPGFIAGKAARSAIGRTPAGKLILAAVRERADGPGPSLAEIAQLMLALGCTDALNLDGGNSTGLYLGSQTLDPPFYRPSRIHNALGIFIERSPESEP